MLIILLNWKLSEIFSSNNRIFQQMPTMPNWLKCMSLRQADTDFPDMLFGHVVHLVYDDTKITNASRKWGHNPSSPIVQNLDLCEVTGCYIHPSNIHNSLNFPKNYPTMNGQVNRHHASHRPLCIRKHQACWIRPVERLNIHPHNKDLLYNRQKESLAKQMPMLLPLLKEVEMLISIV